MGVQEVTSLGIQREHFFFYIGKGATSLRRSIERPSWYKTDIFAANLLGWVAYSTCLQEVPSFVHFNGSLAMLMFHLEQARRFTSTVSPRIVVYGPFIIDCATAWATRNGVLPHRSTSFNQRVKYFKELFIGPMSDIWYSAILEAANSTIGNLLEISITCIHRLACHEAEFDFSRDSVIEVLQYLRAELGDVDFHSALQELY